MLIDTAGLESSAKEVRGNLEGLVEGTGKTPLAVNLVGHALHVLAEQPFKPVRAPADEARAIVTELLDGVQRQKQTMSGPMLTSTYQPIFSNIAFALEICVSAVDQEKWLMLGALPEDTYVPQQLLEIAWRMVWRHSSTIMYKSKLKLSQSKVGVTRGGLKKEQVRTHAPACWLFFFSFSFL